MRNITLNHICFLVFLFFQVHAAELSAQDQYDETFFAHLDDLYGFMLSKAGEGDAMPPTQKAKGALYNFNSWVGRVLAETFVPAAGDNYRFFRRGFRNRDVIVCHWQRSGFQFQCAQTADLFVLSVLLPDLGDKVIPAILRPDGNLWGRKLEQIRFPYFGMYMLSLIGSPQKQMKSKYAADARALGSEGIGDFANRTLAGKTDVAELIFSKQLLEDETSWYRNMFLLKSGNAWVLAFPKYDAGASISPGAFAVREEWF